MSLIKRDYDDGYHDALFYREGANSQRNRARLRLLREWIDGGTLLEIGCGLGGFLRLAEAHFQVEGMDISRHAIETIRPYFDRRVRLGNIEWNTLPIRRYDVVAAFNILEHLRDPGRALMAIAMTLKPGGLLIGSVPHNARPVGRLITQLGNFIDRTHVSTLPPGQWRVLFTEAGFQGIHFFGEIPFGVNRARYLRGKHWDWLAFNLMFVCTMQEKPVSDPPASPPVDPLTVQ